MLGFLQPERSGRVRPPLSGLCLWAFLSLWRAKLIDSTELSPYGSGTPGNRAWLLSGMYSCPPEPLAEMGDGHSRSGLDWVTSCRGGVPRGGWQVPYQQEGSGADR